MFSHRKLDLPLPEVLEHRHREWTGLLFRREVKDHIDLIDPHTAVPDFDYVLRCAAVCNIAVSGDMDERDLYDLGFNVIEPQIEHLARD